MKRLSLALALAGAVLVSGTSGCTGCPAALLTGVLTQVAGELVVMRDGGGPPERIIWPSGYTVRQDGDSLAVFNSSGLVIARPGDRVRLGGGERESGTWGVCGPFEVEPPGR